MNNRTHIFNKDSEDYGELASASIGKKLLAWCTSNKCCFYTREVLRKEKLVKVHIRKSRTRKEVERGTYSCPDCRSALLWEAKYDTQG
jgi:hypothetical protein